MLDSETLRRQAVIFGRYLCRQSPRPLIIERYQHVLTAHPGTATSQEAALLRFIEKHPWAVGYIDGWLALSNPHSEVRRRIYIMLAIMEADPDYTRYFLPQPRNIFYVFVIGWHGFRGAYRALLGLLLTRLA